MNKEYQMWNVEQHQILKKIIHELQFRAKTNQLGEVIKKAIQKNKVNRNCV